MSESSEIADSNFLLSDTPVAVLLFFLAVSLARALEDGGSCG